MKHLYSNFQKVSRDLNQLLLKNNMSVWMCILDPVVSLIEAFIHQIGCRVQHTVSKTFIDGKQVNKRLLFF